MVHEAQGNQLSPIQAVAHMKGFQLLACVHTMYNCKNSLQELIEPLTHFEDISPEIMYAHIFQCH